MWQSIQSLLYFYVVYALAFDEIFVNGEASQEMVEKGRAQYQLLRERGGLPKYGTCWKAAIEHLEEDCRNLSEDTQSDIALHLTNCFLGMSGHETYNCALDKKPNLRAICISSMTDRAFNVYTKFYTHTQNMCWFLRGQIWQETLTENTLKFGKQLEYSAKNQENLIKTQKESLQMQEKMMEHGRFLGKIMEDLYVSSEIHKELLGSLKSWLIGEISWFNTIVFYVSATMITLIITATPRTSVSRLSILSLLFLNFILERLICFIWISYSSYLETLNLYENIYSSIWYCRYIFITLSFLVVTYCAYYYKDFIHENNRLLEKVYSQNCKILDILDSLRTRSLPVDFENSRLSLIDESSNHNKKSNTYLDTEVNIANSLSYNDYNLNHSLSTVPEVSSTLQNGFESDLTDYSFNILRTSNRNSNEKITENGSMRISSRGRVTPTFTTNLPRYNLRNRSITPDLHRF